MLHTRRRALFAAGATLAAALPPRNSRAAEPGLPDLSAATPGKPVPDFTWFTADGAEKRLADYRGRGVVLNLWATWCVPCVAEMPSLDALAAALGSDRVSVLPLSSDRGGAPAVERFYERTNVQHLPVLLDRTGAVARALGVRGIPTTLLIDAAGLERGRVEGGADWASGVAVRMVKLLAT